MNTTETLKNENIDPEIEARIRKVCEDPAHLFNGGFGMRLVEAKKGYVRAEVWLKEEHLNHMGTAHGGLYLTMADVIGGCAASTSGAGPITTSSCHFNFLRATRPESRKVIAEGFVVKAGKRLLVSEVRFSDDTGRLLATSLYEYACL